MKRLFCLPLLVIVFLLTGCATAAAVGAVGSAGATVVHDTHKVLHTVRKTIF